MPRRIFIHSDADRKGMNAALKLEALEPLDPVSNAQIDYLVTNTKNDIELAYIKFQQGDPEKGINGITNEVLIAILLDRLERIQDGKFSNVWYAKALEALETALEKLQERSEHLTSNQTT